MKLKITLLNHIKALFDLILISCLYFGFWIFSLDVLNQKFIFYLALPFVVIFAVPVFIIHINYYLVGSKIVYEISKEGIVIIKNAKKVKYNIKDFNEIVICKTPNKLKDNAVRNFPFESYYYVRFQLRNGENFVITCLHSTKIDKIIAENFKEIKIIKTSNIFPFV